MGVERFFSSIRKDWKSDIFIDLIKPYKHNIKSDKLFIDFNSIVHVLSANLLHDQSFIKNYGNKETFEDFLISEIKKYLLFLVDIVNNKLKLLYIAIDGIPSNAKILEQRKRRYLGQIIKMLIKKYDNEKSNKFTWEKNNISPGTTFMLKLFNQLNDIEFKSKFNCKVIISSHKEEGEGEMKIIKYINNNNIKSAIIYSPDSDMILLLGLLKNKKNNQYFLLRHDQKKSKSGLTYDDYEFIYNYSDIFNFKKNIIDYVKNKIIKTIDENLVIKEIIYLFTLFGDDFLPRLESIKIENDVFILIDFYIINLIENGHIIEYDNNYYKINQNKLIIFFEFLQTKEFLFLQRNYYSRKYFKLEENMKKQFYYDLKIIFNQVKKIIKKDKPNNINFEIIKNSSIYDTSKNQLNNKVNQTLGFFEYKAIKFLNWDKILYGNQSKFNSLEYLLMNLEDLFEKLFYSMISINSIDEIFLNVPLNKNWFYREYLNKENHISKNNKFHSRNLKNKKKSSEKIMYKIEYKLDEFYEIFNLNDSFYDNFNNVNSNNYSLIYNKNKNITDKELNDYIKGLNWIFNYYLNYSPNNQYAYYHQKSPLLIDIIKLLKQKKFFVKDNKFIEKTLLEHMIIITPNPNNLYKITKLTNKEKESIKKIVDNNKNFFIDLNKLIDNDFKNTIDCSNSIFTSKCHFKYLDEKIIQIKL